MCTGEGWVLKLNYIVSASHGDSIKNKKNISPVIFFGGGAHLNVLRYYFWFCVQGQYLLNLVVLETVFRPPVSNVCPMSYIFGTMVSILKEKNINLYILMGKVSKVFLV